MAIENQLVPFKDLPFKPLSSSERELAFPYVEEVHKKALELLGDEIDIAFQNGIYIMRSEFANSTGYRGAEVVVEKWHHDENSDSNERDLSIAFYPDKVINRPNVHIVRRTTNEDGEVIETESGENQMYEVGAAELQLLLSYFQDCNPESIIELYKDRLKILI